MKQEIEFTLILAEFDNKNFSSFFPDNGIAQLAACIKQEGHGVTYHDTNVTGKEDLISHVSYGAPGIVGFKIFYNNISSSISLASEIKKISPDSLIIAGGPHVTIFKDTFFEVTDVFDLLVVGEGERAIIEIGEYYVQSRKLEDVRNVIYRKNNTIFKSPIKLINDLDEIPLPDWTTVTLSNYLPILQLSMSKGCPNQCSFCTHNALSSRSKNNSDLKGKNRVEIAKENVYRKKSFSKVKEELLQNIHNYNTKLFIITDSTPNLKLLEKFCDFLLANEIKIKWACFAKIGLFSKDLYEKAAKAGCVCMFFGIESGDITLLKKIGKSYNHSDIITSISAAREYGIETICSFIIGFPGENEESITATKKLISSLKCDSIFFNPFELDPESPIAFKPDDYRISLSQDWIRKTIIPEGGADPHEIFFYTIDGLPNDEWYKHIESLFRKHDLPIDSEIFDTEYIKVIASKTQEDSKNLFNKLQLLSRNNNKNATQSFMKEYHEICCK